MWFIIVSIAALILLGFFSAPKMKKWNETRKKVNKFPNLCHWPIVGDIEILTAKSCEEIFKIKRRRKWNEKGNTVAWRFHIPFIVVTEPEDIEKILSSVDHIGKGLFYRALEPWLKTGLLTSTGLKWHQRRRILTPAFHFNILQEFLEIFHSESKILVESLMIHANQEIDVKPLITKFTLFSICETAMGINLKHFNKHTDYCKAVQTIGDLIIQRLQKFWLMIDLLFYMSDISRIQGKLLKLLHDFSTTIIAERRKYIREIIKQKNLSYSGRKRVAMLDLLLTSQLKNGEIDDEGIREEVDTFMFEGHDTTAVSLIYTLMLLANNRKCQDKIHEEILAVINQPDKQPLNSDLQELKYMEMCIKESLRLYPSVHAISRTTGSDIKTKEGQIIPENCQIIIEIFDVHRRPEEFPDPEKFDPDRFLPENTKGRHPFAYIPFSGGPRNCIGQKFAMMELKCCLLEILKNFVLEPVDTPESLRLVNDVVLRCDGPVRVKFVPRKIN